MPDTLEPANVASVEHYLERVRGANTEAAKAQWFLVLLHELFEEQPGFIEDYLRGVEKYLKTKKAAVLVKGRADAFFGNVVIEFEKDLRATLGEAKDQLKKYVFCLWNEEGRGTVQFLGIASDGVDFVLFFPRRPQGTGDMFSPDDIVLEELERVNFGAMPALDCYFWLDRHLFRKQVVQPTTENFVKDFGSVSPALRASLSNLERAWEEAEPSLMFQEWNSYLRVVYGSPVGSKRLFLGHTYLATLAKVLAWRRVAGGGSAPQDGEIEEVLKGDYFGKRGLLNFLEEDFFSWIARDGALPFGRRLARELINQLGNYDLRGLPEDVLKGLYQELVDPAERHELGEFYTPDWLAERMTRKMLCGNDSASVLDPACGSGTFLAMAIRHKRTALGDSTATLEHILENVVGVDVHPLAVITAKVNYLLALGQLVGHAKRPMSLPVYLADSIRPPEWVAQTWFSKSVFKYPIPSYRFPLEGEEVFVPEGILSPPGRYDSLVDDCRGFAEEWRHSEELDPVAFRVFLERDHRRVSQDDATRTVLFHLAARLHALIRANRDTIWAFILKNFAKPVLLRGRFDVVIGNPPWLSYRFVESADYQKFLKEEITRTYRLLSGKPQLMTQMDLATLFFVSAADRYLKDGGAIGFVLPRSVFNGDQHHSFRSHSFPLPVGFTEAWDLDCVKPLFKVPACVFFGRKGTQSLRPLPAEVLSGSLAGRNASLGEADERLRAERVLLFLNVRADSSALGTEDMPASDKPSPYKKLFKQGASIVPRTFWFVQSGPLSYDPDVPYLTSASDALGLAKKPWRGISFSGEVESEFIYETLLSTDLVPFGHLPSRLVVLPLVPAPSGYELLTADAARRRGKFGLAKWLGRAEQEWVAGRRDKAGKLSVYEWLDYRKKLTGQREGEYDVLYPTSATTLCACVVAGSMSESQGPAGSVRPRAFIAESKTYWCAVDQGDEADYLLACLNSTLVDRLIKPFQSRGNWGPRDVHKKVWDLPIPRFDRSDRVHVSLAQLGEECSRKVGEFLSSNPTSGPIGRLRSRIRLLFSEELQQIDELVKQIIKT